MGLSVCWVSAFNGVQGWSPCTKTVGRRCRGRQPQHQPKRRFSQQLVAVHKCRLWRHLSVVRREGKRPDARGSARRFPIEKLLQNITNSITTRKFSCTFRCAPRRSRPVSLRLGHAAALIAVGEDSLPRRHFVTSGLPAPVFEAGGEAPSTPLQRKPNRPINCNLVNLSKPKGLPTQHRQSFFFR